MKMKSTLHNLESKLPFNVNFDRKKCCKNVAGKWLGKSSENEHLNIKKKIEG